MRDRAPGQQARRRFERDASAEHARDLMNEDDEEGEGADDAGQGFDEFGRAVHDVSPLLNSFGATHRVSHRRAASKGRLRRAFAADNRARARHNGAAFCKALNWRAQLGSARACYKKSRRRSCAYRRERLVFSGKYGLLRLDIAATLSIMKLRFRREAKANVGSPVSRLPRQFCAVDFQSHGRRHIPCSGTARRSRQSWFGRREARAW